MRRALLYSSLLGVAIFGVVAANFRHTDANFDFLEDADQITTHEFQSSQKTHTTVETFNLHMPFDQAWGKIDSELSSKPGWHLGNSFQGYQMFDLKGKCSITITAGKVDRNLNFLEGTDSTDTYVVVRQQKG